MNQDDKILLTMEVQEMLPRVLFMQEKNQQYFDDWVNSDVYDMEEDVVPAIESVMERVKEGKVVLRSFALIHWHVKNNFQERTGTPSVEAMLGDLTNKMRGF